MDNSKQSLIALIEAERLPTDFKDSNIVMAANTFNKAIDKVVNIIRQHEAEQVIDFDAERKAAWGGKTPLDKPFDTAVLEQLLQREMLDNEDLFHDLRLHTGYAGDFANETQVIPTAKAMELVDKHRPTVRESVKDEWQQMKTAPRDKTTVLVCTFSGYVFPAFYDPTGSVDENEEVCGIWCAKYEGFHPPCWSEGQCWTSNEDEIMSEQPLYWRPTINSIEV